MDLKHSLYKSICYAGVLLITACGGSDVGNQNDAAPEAHAEVFGATNATSDAVEVRSGKDVLLSGANSEGIDDPLLTFSWRQIDSSGYPVNLYERTANTVAFTAPLVPLTDTDGVELEFELQVTDADGVSAVDDVTVIVKPAYDTDQFLVNPRTDERFVLIVAAPPTTLLSAQSPYIVQMTTTAHWQDRFGDARSIQVVEERYTGTVADGTAPSLTDQGNSYFKIPIPLLDLDDINVNFQGDDRQGRIELELVEDAYLSISLSLVNQGTGDIDFYLARETESGFALLDESGLTRDTNQLTFTDEWLRQNLEVESRRSAQNYYDCIDPDGYSETLTEWIENAGFNDYPESVVHTSYVNNYDLNFGRDMYVRRDDNGNVYTYVTNYPTLENIFSGRNEFAIVAMEYSAAPTGNCGDGSFEDDVTGTKIVKFFSYVPNELTGEYVRMNSMNFDGRGERMLPGVCVACHYGDTNTELFNVATLSGIPASAADLDSSFIPWDLDAFLFTEGEDENLVDPVYDPAEVAPEITASFSREAQEDAFRQQNQMALDTFTHDINNLSRFEIPIKMIHGWYGNSESVEDLNFGSDESPLSETELLALQSRVATLPTDATFDGSYVQSGWEDQEDLYHDVYIRNCRLCHAQQANKAIDFDSYDEFISNERLVSYVFEQGVMPLSRLTMDRFWIDFYGSTSPAEQLRAHLNSDLRDDNDVPVDALPGYPVVDVTPAANPGADADVTLDFDETVLFDGTDSLFANAFEWRVDGTTVSTENKYEYAASTPGEEVEVSFFVSNSTEALVSPTTTRLVMTENHVPQAEGVPSPNVNEGATVEVDIFATLCPAGEPDEVACRDVFGDVRSGEQPTLALSGSAVNGNVVISDAASGLIEFTSTEPEATGDGSFGFTLTDSFGETSSPAVVSVTVNPIDGPEVVSPDTCSVTARNYQTESNFPVSFGSAPCLDPSANDTPASGLTLVTSAVGSPVQSGASASVSSGVISYTPPRFFVGNDSFEYTVQDDSLSQRTSRGTVAVMVTATQTFSDLGTDVLSPQCGGCHDGSFTNPVWTNFTSISDAIRNTELMPYSNPEEINLDSGSSTSIATILSSGLFRNACDNAGHTGGNLLCNVSGVPTSTSDLNANGLAILRWVQEGARNN